MVQGRRSPRSMAAIPASCLISSELKMPGLTTKTKEQFVKAATKSIVVHEPREKWIEAIASYMTEPKNIDRGVLAEISEIAVEMQTDAWTAVALWKSQVEQNDE